MPLVAVVVLAGLLAAGAAAEAGRADQARRLVALGGAAGELADRLQQERAAAAVVFARGSGEAQGREFRVRAAATDAAADRFQAARVGVRLPAGLDSVVRRVDGQVAGLPVLRERVHSALDVTASLVVFRYRAVVADLLAYRQGLGQVGVDGETANGLRAAAALSEGVESLGLMQVAVVGVVGAGRLTPAAQQEVVAADARFTEAMQTFRGLAPAGWPARLDARVGGEQVVAAERLHGVVSRAGPDTPLRLGADAGQWVAVVGAWMELMHAAEREFDAELLGEVTAQRDALWRWIGGLGGLVGVGLAVMVGVGWWVARSLTGSLARLRADAEEVATDRLPRMVAQLGSGGVDSAGLRDLMDRAAAPIAVDGRDEVGQVAAAFNAVADSAVRLAGEQAALRASVAGIIEALARRLQQRSDRLMASLDRLERDEQDPQRLGQLFELDHVATLIRRMIGGLQVLSGGYAGRPTSEPVPLADLLRAAVSEIDDYRRVDLGEVDPLVVIGRDAAADLIMLLAELIDNAARFSPPGSPVLVEGRRVGDLLHVQVCDRGVGLRVEDLAAIRARLAAPHRVDHHAAQQMGLSVVARLARRHGVGVDFRSEWKSGSGTRVDITVPAGLFTVAEPARPAPPAVVDADRTQELPAVAAGRPVIPAQRTAEPPLVIFEQVRRSSPWFTTKGDPAQAGMPAQWQAAAAAAAAVQDVPVRVTENGLPVRQAGQRLIPTVATATPGLVRRDPEDVRRRVSAFQMGLGHAGRRSHPVSVKEFSQ